ncbi:hypothetical protein [Paenibacillus sp. 37]|uniref:hypothetical protein n=1 Tax=Paenibacillus sp. JJ778 TaxID=3435411 RepID=UPI00122DF89B
MLLVGLIGMLGKCCVSVIAMALVSWFVAMVHLLFIGEIEVSSDLPLEIRNWRKPRPIKYN